MLTAIPASSTFAVTHSAHLQAEVAQANVEILTQGLEQVSTRSVQPVDASSVTVSVDPKHLEALKSEAHNGSPPPHYTSAELLSRQVSADLAASRRDASRFFLTAALSTRTAQRMAVALAERPPAPAEPQIDTYA
ncbi:MAG: hypothetical protein H7831_07150 [Magnetococcus sp. WYHC-3]